MKKIFITIILLILVIVKIPVEQEVELEVNYNELYNRHEVNPSSRSLDETRIENTITNEVIKPTNLSQDGLEFIIKYEGCITIAKRCEGEKYLTIGYGHYGSDVKEGQTITEEAAYRLLLADLEGYTNQVLQYCEYLNLTQGELDALISFTYNCGYGNLKKLTANQTRTKEEIAEHITAYTKSSSETNRKGLLARREAEKEMFLGGI